MIASLRRLQYTLCALCLFLLCPPIRSAAQGISNGGPVPSDAAEVAAGEALPGNVVDYLRGADQITFPASLGGVNVREADCGIVPDSKTYSVRTFAQDSPPPASPAFSIGRARTFRLDSIGGRVGDRLNMILFVDPPLTDADNVTGFRLWLSLNPDALYPHSATSGGAAARLDYSADGRVTIERSGRRTPVIGEELMELELEGLVTGRSTNVVRIDSLEFMGTTLSRIGGDGLVLLTGCEIGKRFAKGAAIVSLVPNPVVDRVDIGYRSTEGLPMSIRLLDMQGRLMLEKDLGPGDGTEGSVAIGLQGVSSGLYMLELRDGVKVETAPLLIRR